LPERSTKSLMSRWDTIKTQCSTFAGYMMTVLRQNPSGLTDADKVHLYYQTEMSSFGLFICSWSNQPVSCRLHLQPLDLQLLRRSRSTFCIVGPYSRIKRNGWTTTWLTKINMPTEFPSNLTRSMLMQRSQFQLASHPRGHLVGILQRKRLSKLDLSTHLHQIRSS
jgi:hypothetical protein